MSSAFSGVRMVARALPGSGGSAARARASAACFAACLAAHGAAPRRPSLRLRGEPSSLPAAGFAAAPLCPADGFMADWPLPDPPPFCVDAFFDLAISISVRGKAPELLGFARLLPAGARMSSGETLG